MRPGILFLILFVGIMSVYWVLSGILSSTYIFLIQGGILLILLRVATRTRRK